MHDPFGALCRHGDVRRGAMAPGVLTGATFVAKDLFGITGHRNCAGNPDWLRTHEAATSNAPAIDRLLAAGAELTGVATMDELAYSVAGRNAHYGTPINPAFPAGIPGGSSSGPAVAVSGALADFALGTDTTGSIRTPAALCGIVGLRTSYGAVETAGVVPLAPSFDTVGALARDLGLVERVARAIVRAPRDLRLTRVVIADDAFALADAAIRQATEPSLTAMRDRLPARSAAPGGAASLFDWAQSVRTIQSHDAWQVHGPWITATHPAFGPGVAERFAAAARVTVQERVAAERQRDEFARRVLDLVADDAVLVFPTSPSIAPLRSAQEAALDDWRRRVMALTSIANVSGCPQLSVPVGRADGAPAALSLLGPPRSDLVLVRLAATLFAM